MGIKRLADKQYFFTVTSISGIITALYGQDDLHPFIAIKTSRGDELTIAVSPIQEKEVKKLYIGLNLKFRVRLKKDAISRQLLESS